MSEDNISLAILIDDKSIPKDSILDYLVKDSNESSLTPYIISEITGYFPSDKNAAIYKEDQWLFTTLVPENENFEFEVVICDGRNWDTILLHEEIAKREIKTFHIESDEVILIKMDWNEYLTFSVESLMELNLRKDNFLQNNKNIFDPVPKVDSIMEEDKEEYDDELGNNESEDFLLANDEVLKEHTIYSDNEIVNGSSNFVFNTVDDNDNADKYDFNEESDGVLDDLEDIPENVNYENENFISLNENSSNEITETNEKANEPLHFSGDTHDENDTIHGEETNDVNSYNGLVEDSKKVMNKQNSTDDNNKHKDTDSINERKAIRLLKIQSLLGVKSELQTIQKLDFDNLKSNPKQLSKNDDDFQQENVIAFEDEITHFETATITEHPQFEEVSICDIDEAHKCDSHIYTEPISFALTQEESIELKQDITAIENKNNEEYTNCNSEEYNQRELKELGTECISNEKSNIEHVSDIEEDKEINANVITFKTEDIIFHIEESNPETPADLIPNDQDDIATQFIENEDLINGEENYLEPSICVNVKTDEEKEITNIDKNVVMEDHFCNLENSLSAEINRTDISVNSFKERDIEHKDDLNFEINYDGIQLDQNIEITQPSVEHVVEMFEKLGSKDSEPQRTSKVYKTENVEFNRLKEMFENENQISSPISKEDIRSANNINANNDNAEIPEVEIDKVYLNEVENNPEKDHEDNEVIKNNNENKENEINVEITTTSKTFERPTINENRINIKEIYDFGTNLSTKDIKKIVNEKRERLAVNDDYKYPDSVTPTKVEHTLSQSPEYNVPFMDDEAFYKESWYEESNDRWTSLEGPININHDKNLYKTETESLTVLEPSPSTELIKETIENKHQIQDESVKKIHKRRGLMNLCGCVGRR